MNWDMLSAISEIFGAVAVLVTLIYLTVQTKQSTVSIQASTRQAIAENDQQFLPEFISMAREIIENTPYSDRPIWLSVFD